MDTKVEQYKIGAQNASNNPRVDEQTRLTLLPAKHEDGRRIEIWYAINADFRSHGIFVPAKVHAPASAISPASMASHVKIGVVRYSESAMWRDDVFRAMQGENWSPNGEARELVQQMMGFTCHTSMSVGDVLVRYNPDGTNETYACASVGWKRID